MTAQIAIGLTLASMCAVTTNAGAITALVRRATRPHRRDRQHRAATLVRSTAAPTRPRRSTARSRLALLLFLVAAAAFGLAACGGDRPGTPTACGAGGGAAGRPAKDRVQHFGHIVVIAFENEEYGDVIGDRQAPTFNRLAHQQALLTRYCGVAHPSLPNYLALVSGSTHGITDDCTDCMVHGRNLADSLEEKHRSWKTYAEGLPHVGFTGAEAGRYAKKHDPLVYFADVRSNPRRLARIVPLDELDRDLAAHTLPDFSLVIPDLCHDIHDCSVATGDEWLKSFLPRLLSSPQLREGVVFIVFDEADQGDDAGGGGHTVALAVGPTVRPGSRATAPLTHYNLLRTIEDAWGLPRLGRSASARPIAGIWRQGR